MLMLIPEKELWLRSTDNRFGIRLEATHVACLIAECQKARNQEAGGILIGHYSRDHAMAFVTEVTSAPIDSKRGRTWFDAAFADSRGSSRSPGATPIRFIWESGIFTLGTAESQPGRFGTDDRDRDITALCMP